jgi:beta-hydroxylase
MLVEHTEFPFLAALVTDWQIIKGELDALDRNLFVDWPERDIYLGQWRAFPLHKFGKKVHEFCVLCPHTTALVEGIPGLVTAGFSSLLPGTHILPHCGYTSAVLRCHLGLKTPPNCGLRVGSKTREWRAGECFVFDDTYEHEAWNRSDETRTVLLIDFKRDPSAVVKFPKPVYSY